MSLLLMCYSRHQSKDRWLKWNHGLVFSEKHQYVGPTNLASCSSGYFLKHCLCIRDWLLTFRLKWKIVKKNLQLPVLLSVINTTRIHKYNIDSSLKNYFISQHLHFLVSHAITIYIFKITRKQILGCSWIKNKILNFLIWRLV